MRRGASMVYDQDYAPRSPSSSHTPARSSAFMKVLGMAQKEGEPAPLPRRDTFWKTIPYYIEGVMSKYGRLVQIPMLCLVEAVQVVVFGFLFSFVWRPEPGDPRDQERVSKYIEGFWSAWTFMADGGTQAKHFHAEQRLLSGVITASGIIYLATVLAFIVDMVRERMDSMRVGKGQVYEKGHVVILHWTDRTIPLIHELCIANESEGGGVIVVLAKESLTLMNAELALQVPKFLRKGTKIVLRHGNPAIISDLIKVSAFAAKAVVILAWGVNADESDSSTLRCILSLKSTGKKLNAHVVAEVRDVDNEPLLQLVGGKFIETFVSHDMIGRLMLMSVRQIGLADVYDTILGFEGNEFYMKAWPDLYGLDFGELIERFPKAIPIGICDGHGTIFLNPSSDRRLVEGDQVVVIAEDEFSYKPEVRVEIVTGPLPPQLEEEAVPEKVLICGWRRDIRDILKLLNLVVRRRSEVHTMTHCVSIQERNELLLEEGLNVMDLENIDLIHHAGNTSVRRRLEQLPLETYSSCLIFADQAFEEDSMQADSHSIATLVLIRDIQASRQQEVTCPVTCEVLDSRTQRTISAQRRLCQLSDFVQSNKFVARILAMIAKNRNVKKILSELVGATGCSLFIVPSSSYVLPQERISFWSVAKRAALRRATLIGYQDRHADPGAGQSTTLNPENKHQPRRWDRYDFAIITGNTDTDDAGLPGFTHKGSSAANSQQTSPGTRDINGIDLLRQVSEVHNLDAAAALLDVVKPIVEEGARSSGASNLHKADVAEAVPDEGGIHPSADIATSVMTKLVEKIVKLMSETEQRRFGSVLMHLGYQMKGGTFPLEALQASLKPIRHDSSSGSSGDFQ